MANNETHTYSLAKDIFNNAALKEDILLSIEAANVSIFRKHLSEMIKRKESNKRFTTRFVLNKNKLKIIRIE